MEPGQAILDEIGRYWREHRHCTQVHRHIPEGSDAMRWIDSQLAAYPWFETRFNVVSFAAKGVYEPPRCKACGKVLRIDNAREGKIYCSGKCATNDKEVRDRTRATVLERYGSESIMGNDEMKARQHASMREKYGSEYTMTSEVLNKKRNETIKDKYGVDYYSKTDEFKKKVKSTCLERYGVGHYSKTDEFRSRQSRRHHLNSYELIIQKWSDYVIPLFPKEEFGGIETYDGKIYKWKCMKCGLEFESPLIGHGYREGLRNGYMPLCPNCFPVNTGKSFMEDDVLEFIKSIYDGEIITNSRSVLESRHELDIYIPDKHVAIEFDGLHWHSEDNGIGIEYHLGKTDECHRLGIHLIHIFEDEWVSKPEIVMDRIRSILCIGLKSVYARKCNAFEIDIDNANRFLEENHLQGGDNSSIQYGLYNGQELVAVMTFGRPRFNKSYDWELIRFASKIGTIVIGGASRLFRKFLKEHSGTVISYADRRYSDGNLYRKIGFKFKSNSKPNYWWCKQKQKLSRYQCQKHLLNNLLGDKFNPDLTEDQNMRLAGYEKVYDCGNMVFEYTGE